jgi:DNA gyrase/topoisomerase IV subunit A
MCSSEQEQPLLGRIAELEKALAEAQVLIQALKDEIETLKRAGKRQAVPFERRKKVEKPKKRGRRKGKGEFKNREKPKEEEINETKKAEICGCPDCGGELVDAQRQLELLTDDN